MTDNEPLEPLEPSEEYELSEELKDAEQALVEIGELLSLVVSQIRSAIASLPKKAKEI